MLPQGSVWQALRASALDVFPSEATCRPTDAINLAEWLRKGAFHVASNSPRAVVLEAPAADVGALLFSDAGRLLDHAEEHAIQCRLRVQGGQWESPAWASVTMYYWAYFVALALTRMLGAAPWFLSDEEASTLSTLSPSGPKIGPGPRLLLCGNFLSASIREVELRKANQTRLHDAVWKTLFRILREKIQPLASTGATSPELRLYLSLLSAANRLGDAWPSDFRNQVNYVPGLAYGAARGKTPTAVRSTALALEGLSADELTNLLGSDTAALTSSPISAQIGAVARALVSTTVAFDALARALFAEVADRRNLDRRWLLGRANLRKSQWHALDSTEWPIRGNTAA